MRTVVVQMICDVVVLKMEQTIAAKSNNNEKIAQVMGMTNFCTGTIDAKHNPNAFVKERRWWNARFAQHSLQLTVIFRLTATTTTTTLHTKPSAFAARSLVRFFSLSSFCASSSCVLSLCASCFQAARDPCCTHCTLTFFRPRSQHFDRSSCLSVWHQPGTQWPIKCQCVYKQRITLLYQNSLSIRFRNLVFLLIHSMLHLYFHHSNFKQHNQLFVFASFLFQYTHCSNVNGDCYQKFCSLLIVYYFKHFKFLPILLKIYYSSFLLEKYLIVCIVHNITKYLN